MPGGGEEGVRKVYMKYCTFCHTTGTDSLSHHVFTVLTHHPFV